MLEGAEPSPGNAPETGVVVEGSVTGTTHFGAFVSLDGGGIGLIHISELAYAFVRDVREFVKTGDRVKVKVLRVNPVTGKFDLSLRQVNAPPEGAVQEPNTGRRRRVPRDGADPAFEEKLARFIKSSQERQLDRRKNLDSKRGRGSR